MKMYRSSLFMALPIFFVFVSIFENPENIEKRNPLIGVWVYDSYENEGNVFIKEQQFDKDKAGFEFKEDGTLVKRQNVGWCGTPPVTYGNYDGKWKMLEDGLLEIEYDYWGGRDTIGLKILDLNDEKLKISYVRNR